MYVFEGERGDAVPEGTGRVGERPAVLNPGHHILHFLAAVRYVFYRRRGTPVQKGQRKKYIAYFRLVQVWRGGGGVKLLTSLIIIDVMCQLVSFFNDRPVNKCA